MQALAVHAHLVASALAMGPTLIPVAKSVPTASIRRPSGRLYASIALKATMQITRVALNAPLVELVKVKRRKVLAHVPPVPRVHTPPLVPSPLAVPALLVATATGQALLTLTVAKHALVVTIKARLVILHALLVNRDCFNLLRAELSVPKVAIVQRENSRPHRDVKHVRKASSLLLVAWKTVKNVRLVCTNRAMAKPRAEDASLVPTEKLEVILVPTLLVPAVLEANSPSEQQPYAHFVKLVNSNDGEVKLSAPRVAVDRLPRPAHPDASKILAVLQASLTRETRIARTVL